MASSRRATHGRPQRAPRRRAFLTIGALVALIVLVVGVVGILAYTKLSSARDDLNRASVNASALQAALTNGDQDKASVELDRLQKSVRSAQSSLDSSILSVAAKTPLLGKNVTAVRTVADAARTVSDEGLPPLVAVADKFNARTFNPKDGTIDVASLAELTPSLTTASEAIDRADEQIRSIDASALLSQLRGPVTDAQDKLGAAASTADRATTASKIVPAMLEGKHTYLLMFQNNAEIRATGGLPGSVARLEVDNGSITLAGQAPGGTLGDLPADAVAPTPEEEALFTNKLVRDFRDVNFTPDFPRAAQIAAAMVENKTGADVDGVMSLDPVTLSYILKGIGTIGLDDGTRLTADNAVDLLLNNVYVNYPDGPDQDAFFEDATARIFDKVMAGAGDPTAVLKALTRGTEEGRVSMWLKDDAINDEIASTPLAHTLPTGKAASPAIGYYINDATGAKMQYYLKTAIAGESTKCTSKDVQSYTTTMSLTSSAPADSAALPVPIRGTGFGAEPGSMLMNVYVYGPVGGTIGSVSFDGTKTDQFQKLTHEGRPVAVVTVQVDPGKTVKLGVDMTGGSGQSGPTAVSTTPSIVPGPSTQTWKSSC